MASYDPSHESLPLPGNQVYIPASPAEVTRLSGAIEDIATTGSPYLVGQLREDDQSLIGRQLSPAERKLVAGQVFELHTDAGRGQRVQAVTYSKVGSDLLREQNSGTAPHSVLRADKTIGKSFFKAWFEFLDNDETQIRVLCSLEGLRTDIQLAIPALRSWAQYWGLEGFWDYHVDAQRSGADKTKQYLQPSLPHEVADKAQRNVANYLAKIAGP